MSLQDATQQLQEEIYHACDSKIEMRLQKGDYAVTTLTIPKGCELTIASRDRTRILYTGKRNRPMFVLEENAHLILKEKLELYYNTNNIQEVTKLMVKRANGAVVEVSNGVKISLFSIKQ